jgi:DNA-binding MarR family transcriptional regulator
MSSDLERDAGLPSPWFETLVRLRRSDPGGMRMNEMATDVAFAPSSFSRLVDRMEADGLVQRSPDPAHRRATLLRLTARGEKRIDQAVEVHEPIARARLVDLLSDEELEVLESVTRKIRDANRPGARR